MAVQAEPALDALKLRADFPIFEQTFNGKPLAYLNSAATSQKPRQVLDAMTEFYETSYSNVHRGVYALGERATAGPRGRAREGARVRQRADRPRDHLRPQRDRGAEPRRVRLRARAARPGRRRARDRSSSTTRTSCPWQYVANRTGAEFRIIPIDDNGDLAARRARGPREREGRRGQHRLELARHDRRHAAARRLGARARRDPRLRRARRPRRTSGSTCRRSAPTSSPSPATRCCGPSGIGFLWGRTELLLEMEPFLLGGHMIRNVGDERTTWAELPAKFEAGTSPVAEAVGLGAAIDYLEAVGLEAIEAHEHALAGLRARACSARSRASRSTARRPSGAPASSCSTSRACTRTTWRRSSTSTAIAIRAGHHCCQPLMRKLGVAGDEPRELLPLHRARGDRPARRRACSRRKELDDVSEFEDMYREVILDHYKNPRNYGLDRGARRAREGPEPALRRRGDDLGQVRRRRRDDRGHRLRGPRLRDLAGGDVDAHRHRQGQDGRPGRRSCRRRSCSEEIGIPLTPIRLKCAILGLGVLKVALHESPRHAAAGRVAGPRL